MTWDDQVAAYAQNYANQRIGDCDLAHSGGQYGENIYATSGSSKPSDVVGSWVSEVKSYDYATNTCSDGQVCGHYTQVVWRKSERLGCGVTTCTANSPFGGSDPWQFWVCNYDPPGNFNGEKPY